MMAVPQTLGFCPGTILRTYGMRRSGNHAIINWLMRNAPGETVFLNNCRQKKPALETFQGSEINGKRQDRSLISDKPVADGAADGALLLMSYEDYVPEVTDKGLDQVSAEFSANDITYEILIYRSFLNWSASLLKKIQGNSGYSGLDRLRIMMGAMERYVHMLSLVDQPGAPNMVSIHYDRWCQSSDYRAATLKTLGMECRDDDLGAVQRYGGGSSFQKETQEAHDLSVHERWRMMADDQEFQIVRMAAQQDTRLQNLMERLMPQEATLVAQSVTRPTTRSGWFKELLNPKRIARVR